MTVFGIIASIAAAVALALFLGPYGMLVLFSIMFGLVLNIHLRTKEIHNDLQRIKEKLGILDKDDFHLTDEEIEAELEKEWLENEKIDLNRKDKEQGH